MPGGVTGKLSRVGFRIVGVEALPESPRIGEVRVSKAGNVTVRYLSRLRHIALGRAYAGEPVRLLIAGEHIRVVRRDGSLLRELILDARRDYQPLLHSSTMS